MITIQHQGVYLPIAILVSVVLQAEEILPIHGGKFDEHWDVIGVQGLFKQLGVINGGRVFNWDPIYFSIRNIYFF
ncbi:MAG: hypothetical protein HQK55_11510 [Deltaproteobacteria bacterium]|nr:hypothetical protein [Deltaproteobacteria bacterium]